MGPTPAPTSIKVSASGDPHLVNLHGQRFDIFQPGIHTLLQVPRGKLLQAKSVLLRVNADAQQMGGACADIYFQSLNITGNWVDQQRTGPLAYYAGKAIDGTNSTSWMRFGPVLDLRVVFGHTNSGIEYLNLYARHLSMVKYPIGGLLGADDHTQASTPSAACKRTVTLLGLGGGKVNATKPATFSKLSRLA